jgi:hypothetical protein
MGPNVLPQQPHEPLFESHLTEPTTNLTLVNGDTTTVLPFVLKGGTQSDVPRHLDPTSTIIFPDLEHHLDFVPDWVDLMDFCAFG